MYRWILGAFLLRYYFQENQISAGWAMVMIKESKGKEDFPDNYMSIIG